MELKKLSQLLIIYSEINQEEIYILESLTDSHILEKFLLSNKCLTSFFETDI